ncbi:CDP-alcohol phosphatidyltransferase family protein [Candidatus Uhrbacteria bacterium]|nr:CDP-alcohol phosphatidyltransferase family protein [Candidatus Uhrbacteria bacterium]
MLMTNENIKYFPHDRLMEWTVLRFVPSFVRPNHFTILRMIMIPFVLYFFLMKQWDIALPIFLIAAATDAIDGSLARVRKQITLWGTMADPVADKLLIGSTVVIFVAQEIHVLFAVLIVFFELLIVIGALYRKHRGLYASANNYGKIKMLLQVTGVSLLLVAKLAGFSLAVPFATATFALAIAFAIVSLLTYSS